MAAGDFTLDEAVATFGLRFSRVPSEYMDYYWTIEQEIGTMEFPMTPGFESLIDNYSRNFDRTSEATCRTAVDFILNECLTVMKGNNVENTRPHTPKPFDNIGIHGEVSFTHTLLTTNTYLPSNTVITGRVDHGIGRVLDSRIGNATQWHKRRFHALLLLMEAKFDGSLGQVLPQLVVYLASLRQSRIQRQRDDISVHGVASDGFRYIFVKITEDGTVMESQEYDIGRGDMTKVLACMRYLLEMTANRSPARDEHDPMLRLDDNSFMNPPGDEDDV